MLMWTSQALLLEGVPEWLVCKIRMICMIRVNFKIRDACMPHSGRGLGSVVSHFGHTRNCSRVQG